MATIDDVFALLQTVSGKIDALTTDVAGLTDEVNVISVKADIMDDKIDILSGDTTSTNVLDKVLSMDRRVKTIEFKIMKGK